MAALTQDRSPVYLKFRGKTLYEDEAPIATGETVYKGSKLVQSLSTGRVKAAGVLTAAAWTIKGVCTGFRSDANGNNEGSGVGDTAGTVRAKFVVPEQYLVDVAAAIRTEAALNTTVICADDQTVGGTAIGTNTGLNQILAGTLVAFQDGSSLARGWLRLGQAGIRGKITI